MIDYNWKRFWYPRGTELKLYDNNYLPDPEEKDGIAQYLNPEVKTFDEINHFNCLILLGEPGIGKTIFLKNEREKIENDIRNNNALSIWKDLNDVREAQELDKYVFETPKFIQWKNGKENLYIYLDSFDECKSQDKLLPNKIENRIEEVRSHLSRLYLRIVCRSSEWPVELEDFLRNIWHENSLQIYSMAPLRRKDIISAAKNNGLDADKFLEGINEKNITIFARIPLLLSSLIEIYINNGSLPSSKTELFESRSKIICSTKKNHHERVSSNLKMMIVGRIAFISLFSGFNSIWLGKDKLLKPKDSLFIEDLLGFDETIDGNTTSIDILDYIYDAINTAFFTRTEQLKVQWVHISQQAFLAAWYLHHRQVFLKNILNMVSDNIEGTTKIIPRYKEMLSWMCNLNNDLFEEIVKIDPIVLAKSDTSIYDEKKKEIIVHSIFLSYEKGNIHPQDLFFTSNLENLNFQGLDVFLKPYIENKEIEPNLRAFALELVNECRVKALEVDIVKIAFDKADHPGIRTLAIEALGNMGNDDNKRLLLSLVNLPREEDPYDEIKGHCLEILYPDYIDSPILFEKIKGRNRQNHFGSFSRFISQILPKRLKDEHLIDALYWIRTQPGLHNVDRIYRDLIIIIIVKAFRKTKDDIIYRSLITTLLDRINKNDWIFEILNKYQDNDGSIEMNLKVRMFLNMIEESDNIEKLYIAYTFHSPFLKEIGIKAVVDMLISTENKENQDKYIQFIVEWLKWWQNITDMENVALIYKAKENNQFLQENTSFVFRTYQLDSEEAKKEKSHYELINPKTNNQDRISKNKKDKSQEIFLFLQKFDESNIRHFETIAYLMVNYGDYPPTNLKTNITANEAWNKISDVNKTKILNGAKYYLLNASPNENHFVAKKKIPGQTMTLERSLILISTLELEYLETINHDVWDKWIYYIFASYGLIEKDNKKYYKTILKNCFHKSHEKFISTLSTIIDEENTAHGDIYILQDLSFIRGEKIEKLLINKLDSDNLESKSYSSLLEALIKNNRAKAIEYSTKFLQEPISSPTTAVYQKQIILTKSLISNYVTEIWDLIWNRIEANQEYGKDVFKALANRLLFEISPLLHQLSERNLKDLYIWLKENFPSEPTPDADGMYSGTPETELRKYRTFTFNEISTRGTIESINVLREIQNKYPEDKWLQNVILKAKDILLDLKPSLKIKEIKEILFSKDKRIIRNSEQLCEYVIEALEKLEIDLQGETSAAIDLWNKREEKNNQNKKIHTPKDETVLSDYIKRFLQKELTSKKVIITRETEITKGQKTDIYVSLINDDNQKITIVIEAKGGWNPNICKDIKGQLLEKYMKSNFIKSGIYLIGWFDCEKWNDPNDSRKKTHKSNFKDKNIQQAREYFKSLADNLSGNGYQVRLFILDCSLK